MLQRKHSSYPFEFVSTLFQIFQISKGMLESDFIWNELFLLIYSIFIENIFI